MRQEMFGNGKAVAAQSDSTVGRQEQTPASKPPFARFPAELIAETQDVFGRRTGRNLTSEEARQILENLVGFFDTLNQWQREQHSERAPTQR
jgi:hypothetical protein